MLIHGCTARIGDGRLFNDAYLPAGAGQRPSGAKPHNAGAENKGGSLCYHGVNLCRFGQGMGMLVLSIREGQIILAWPVQGKDPFRQSQKEPNPP